MVAKLPGQKSPVGHQPTVAMGSFQASRLIEVAAEATANRPQDWGPKEVGTHR